MKRRKLQRYNFDSAFGFIRTFVYIHMRIYTYLRLPNDIQERVLIHELMAICCKEGTKL